MKKRIVITLLIAAMTMSLCAGCGGKKTETKEEPKVKTEKVKEPELTEADLEKFLTGLDDHYVLQGAKDVDYTYGLAYDRAVVRDIQADSKAVKVEEPGTYKVTYKVTVDIDAMDDYEEASDAKTDTETDTKADVENKENVKEEVQTDISKDASTETTEDKADQEENLTEVEIEKEVEVVDKDKAQDLADQDEIVWGDANVSVPKSDGTEVQEEVKVPESAAKDPEKVETTKPDNNQQASKPQDNASKPAQKPSESKPSKPSQPSAPAHQHNWVPVTKTEQKWIEDEPAWDEPIYERRTICTCGADLTHADIGAHYVDCNGSYSNKTVQTGTKHHDAKGHYESKTVTTGYKCSCGATK